MGHEFITYRENCLETCSAPPLPGTQSVYDFVGAVVFVGDVVTYSCSFGYTFSDSTTQKASTCLTGDVYSLTAPQDCELSISKMVTSILYRIVFEEDVSL